MISALCLALVAFVPNSVGAFSVPNAGAAVGTSSRSAVQMSLNRRQIATAALFAVPAAASASVPACGIPGGSACTTKKAEARSIFAATKEKRKPVNTSAFPQCAKANANNKSCPNGAGFLLEGDKRLENGKGVMYKGDKGGNGGSGDKVSVRIAAPQLRKILRAYTLPMHAHVVRHVVSAPGSTMAS